MMKKILSILMFILVSANCYANPAMMKRRAAIVGRRGGGVETTIISQLNSNDEVVLASYCVGQSFTMVGDNITKISVWSDQDNYDTSMRVGVSDNLSATYLEEDTVKSVNGETIFEFSSLTGLTNGNTYYFIVEGLEPVEIARQTTGGYAGGQYYYGNDGTWNVSNTVAAHDLKFEILGIV